jgi:DNA-binding transcriptional ArsR family regulator
MATVRSTRERRTPTDTHKRPTTSARRVDEAGRAARLLKEVGEPTRLQVLVSLADGRKSARQIGESLGRSTPEINRDLALLRASRVVDSHREGKETFHQLTEPGSRFLDSTFGLVEEAGPAPGPAISKAELKKLIKKVGSVVDDPEAWLNSPNRRFEDRRPIDLIGTDDEFRVHIIIGALEQGFFS